MSTTNQARRVIQINKSLIEPTALRLKTVKPRKIGDYPHVPRIYLQAAQKLSSPFLMGPPICDELIAFVQHLFTEEEAGVVRHMAPFIGKTAANLARAEYRPIQEIEPILHGLAFEKRAIACSGPDNRRKYSLVPITGGIFEMALISHSMDTLTDWHRRFIELFEASTKPVIHWNMPMPCRLRSATCPWERPSMPTPWHCLRTAWKSCSTNSAPLGWVIASAAWPCSPWAGVAANPLKIAWSWAYGPKRALNVAS